MTSVTTKPELSQLTTESNSHLFDDWFDPIESGIRDRVRELIEEMIRSELDAVLSRPRYGRRVTPAEGGDVVAGAAGGDNEPDRLGGLVLTTNRDNAAGITTCESGPDGIFEKDNCFKFERQVTLNRVSFAQSEGHGDESEHEIRKAKRRRTFSPAGLRSGQNISWRGGCADIEH
jgi:hypothetical protein